MFLCFNKIPSLGKKKPGWKPTKESTFFLKLRHLASVLRWQYWPEFLWGWQRLERLPSPWITFWVKLEMGKDPWLSSGAKAPPNPASRLVWKGWELCSRAGAHVQQLRSSWEMCDVWPWHWGSLQPKSSVLPGTFVWAPNPSSVLGAFFSPGGQPIAAMYGFTFAVRAYLHCRKLLQLCKHEWTFFPDNVKLKIPYFSLL